MPIVTLAAALFLQGTAAQATAAEQTSYDNPITNPVWTKTPTPEELQDNYPWQPMLRGVDARTSLLCTAGASGRLENCRVLTEEPEDLGFGDATMKLSKRFRLQLRDAEGESVVGRPIRIPMAWLAPKDGR